MKARLFRARRWNPPGVSWYLMLEDGVEIQTDTEERAKEIAAKLEVEVVDSIAKVE
jgi:hypothetical protein